LRGTHADDLYGQQMQRMGKVLKSDQDIRDVAAYLTSLGIDG
jgi:cytochrome c553